jgi:ketosteroid isomerase-like protein
MCHGAPYLRPFSRIRGKLLVVRTVSDQNVEIARRTFELIRARDLDGLLDIYDPDIEFEPLTGIQVEIGGYRGHAGVRRYFDEITQVWEEMLPHADDVRAVDNQVVILGGCAVRGRGSGAISDNPMAWILTLRDGKVVRHRAYRSREEALDAAGLAD